MRSYPHTYRPNHARRRRIVLCGVVLVVFVVDVCAGIRFRSDHDREQRAASGVAHGIPDGGPRRSDHPPGMICTYVSRALFWKNLRKTSEIGFPAHLRQDEN